MCRSVRRWTIFARQASVAGGMGEFERARRPHVLIGASEHFWPRSLQPRFFCQPTKTCRPDGVLLLHTITGLTSVRYDHGFAAHVVAGLLPYRTTGATSDDKFRLGPVGEAGFTLTRRQSPQPHYCDPRPVGRRLQEHKKRVVRDPVRRGSMSVYEIPDRLSSCSGQRRVSSSSRWRSSDCAVR